MSDNGQPSPSGDESAADMSMNNADLVAAQRRIQWLENRLKAAGLRDEIEDAEDEAVSETCSALCEKSYAKREVKPIDGCVSINPPNFCCPAESRAFSGHYSDQLCMNDDFQFDRRAQDESQTSYRIRRHDLPKREIIRFNGDPLKYWVFLRSFQSNIMNNVKDAATRLSFLIDYCEGKARRAIESCAVLPPEEGFKDAMETLKARFGRPHVIARSVIGTLSEGPVLKANDMDAFGVLADEMKTCLNTLNQLGCESHLNAPYTLASVVKRLPYLLQMEWFKRSSEIARVRGEPTFNDLYLHVCECIEIASAQMMYTNVPGLRSETKVERLETRGVRATTLLSRNNLHTPGRFPHCACCQGSHYLDQCERFKSMTIEQRTNYVKQNALCELCLKNNHASDSCRSRNLCGLNSCRLKHHPLLHLCTPPYKVTAPDGTLRTNFEADASCSSFLMKSSPIALCVVPVTIHGPSGMNRLYALLDNGSDTTMIEKTTAMKLGLTGTETSLNITTLSGSSPTKAFRVEFQIEVDPPGGLLQTLKAWAVPSLPKVNQLLPSKHQQALWKHLKDLNFATAEDCPISLIIGMDAPSMHWVLESRTGKPSEPYAIRTPLGWVFMGPIADTRSNTIRVNSLSSCVDRELLIKVGAMYNTEFNDDPAFKRQNSRDDDLAMSMADSSIQKINGHYQIALPWKEGCPTLESNIFVSQYRLRSLKHRLVKDPNLHQLYTDVIEDYVFKGYAERVEDEYLPVSRGRLWYLPHHPVIHPLKPGKVRVVFDCASKFQGSSLNTQLLSGPDLMNDITGVLLRFRQYPYAVTADIESMFHQVRVPIQDRDVLRFLWWQGGNLEERPRTYRMVVHPFGATSSPFCASFALRKALKDYKKENVVDAERSFYVDDFLYSAESLEDLTAFMYAVLEALKAGGFRLTKWSSNQVKVLERIPSDERAQQNLDLDLHPTSWHRTLGVQWDLSSDEFVFAVKEMLETPTKRKMLSYIASIYDPLGFVGPAILPGRLLFQQLHKIGIGWDDELAGDAVHRWRSWITDMSKIVNLQVPRCLVATRDSSSPLEMHCFSDASEKAYGAVVYLRSRNIDGSFRCSFVWGKSRVAPIKAVTIPRLELTAAVLSARLALHAVTELSLKIDDVTFWTDSMIVIQSIRNTTTRFQSFVANRLATIHELSKPKQWNYVSSDNNPADLSSRGASPDRLRKGMWISGPPFLLLNKACWPTEPLSTAVLPPEFMRKDQGCNVTCHQVSTFGPDLFSRYNSWPSLIRAIAWLRRFCYYIMKGRKHPVTFAKYLTSDELLKANDVVIRMTQEAAFSTELQLLSRSSEKEIGQPIKVSCSPLRKLNPFIHQGTLRVGGRLKWAPLPFNVKHPYILPRRHHVTNLIIRYYHEKNAHMGANQVLADIRQRYWIVQGLAAVKSVVSDCFLCRRWHSIPCHQTMAPLPVYRTASSSGAFAFVGVDYFGPLLVKKGRGTEKRYGCIFTCMSVRAVHIEIANTLETDSFLCAFNRFVARRGSPTHLYSDNGTNFRGSETEIKRCLQKWDQSRINRQLSDSGCDWHFNTPKASHQGGVWERMIRSVRRIMRSLLGESLVDDETLCTVISEVEKILNDRPLMKLSSDPNDYATLTPNHLLLLHRNPATAEPNIASFSLARRWRRVNHLAELFWRRWSKEYLPTLQSTHKWLRQGRNLSEGDLVLIGDAATSRGQWAKGIVIEAVQARDGAVRVVTVRTPRGTFNRDVRQVYLLEAHHEADYGQSASVDVGQGVGSVDST